MEKNVTNLTDAAELLKFYYPINMSGEVLISLGDLYADSCVVCSERADWGISRQNGPEGCMDAIKKGKVYCEKHIPLPYNAMLSEKKAFLKWFKNEIGNKEVFSEDVLKLLFISFCAGIKYEQDIWEDDIK
jgi:hypothetical protein